MMQYTEASDNPFPSWSDKDLAGAIRTHLATVAMLSAELRQRRYDVLFKFEGGVNGHNPEVNRITKRIEL